LNRETANVSDRCALRRYPSAAALANAAAHEWIRLLTNQPAHRERFCLALSGGRIAQPLYAAAVRVSKDRRTLWDKVEFFFADDRWVPRDDPESNYRVAYEHLFESLRVAADRVHPLYTGGLPEFAAAQVQAEMLQRTPINVDGTPILDLIILGVGEDGHVASLFPGAPPEVTESHAIYLPVIAPKPPPQRITLTYATIAAARHVIVLVSGPGKAAALRASLSADAQTPLARVVRSRPWTVVLTDVAAE